MLLTAVPPWYILYVTVNMSFLTLQPIPHRTLREASLTQRYSSQNFCRKQATEQRLLANGTPVCVCISMCACTPEHLFACVCSVHSCNMKTYFPLCSSLFPPFSLSLSLSLCVCVCTISTRTSTYYLYFSLFPCHPVLLQAPGTAASVPSSEARL